MSSHYKGIPKSRPARIDPYGKIKPLSHLSEGEHPVPYLAEKSVEVFIDGDNGNDTNDGLSENTAVATFYGLRQKFPSEFSYGSRIVVNLAGVGGFGFSATGVQTYTTRTVHVGGGEYNFSYVFRGPQMVLVSPTTGSATPTMTSYSRVDNAGDSDASGRRTKITFDAPGWTADDFLSGPAFLRVKRADDLVLCESPITGNTEDSVFLDVVITDNLIKVTDTFEIVQPGVKIVGDSADFNLNQVVVKGFGGVANLEVNDPDGQGATFERVHFKSLSVVGVFGIIFDRCVFESYCVMRGGHVGLINCKAPLFGLEWACQGKAERPRPRRDTDTSPINVGILNHLVVVGGILSIGNVGNPGYMEAQLGISVYNSVGSGIIVGGNSMLLQHTNALIAGSGNAGVGLLCKYGGKAFIEGGSVLSITGDDGDIRVGAETAVSYGTGEGQFQEVAGFNGSIIDEKDSSAIRKIYV